MKVFVTTYGDLFVAVALTADAAREAGADFVRRRSGRHAGDLTVAEVEAGSARAALVGVAREFQHDYLSRAGFAEANGLTADHATRLLDLAKAVETSPHPEA